MISLKDQYADDLLKSIPVVKGMNISIDDLKETSLRIKAPLDSNINYEGTAFGGSLNTACILSCYLLVHHVLRTQNVDFKSLVIQDSQIQYLTPVSGDFSANAQLDDKSVSFLLRQLRSLKRGRIEVRSQVTLNDLSDIRVEFSGRFVVTL
jgi:thioesterase domain-containing protein